ncbi:MAG: right-handed parallel beta-helix repeat-containing protein [Cytophagales bacterium]|nr:right-handed parallel beta-helix repeat-containing protein [Armatimonadota bacterium]
MLLAACAGLLVLALSASAVPPEPPKVVNVKDFGAKGDGVTDDTPAINAAIEAAQRRGPGAVVLLPSGRYRTAVGSVKSVVVHNADHLTIQGAAGTVIVSADLDKSVFDLSDSRFDLDADRGAAEQTDAGGAVPGRRLPHRRPHRDLGLAAQETAVCGGPHRRESPSDKSYTLTLDREVVTERVGAGTGPAFGMAAMTDGLDRIINVDTVGQETLIRNSKFQVFRAKCLNLKAANCTIESCTFRSSFQPAISAASEWFFEEGPPIRNLTVRGCTFYDCNHPNIDIGAASHTGVPGAAPDPNETPENAPRDSTNLRIEGNTFVGYGTIPSVFAWAWPLGPAIHVTHAARVVVRNNRFGPLAATAPKGTKKILIEQSEDVSVGENQDVSR